MATNEIKNAREFSTDGPSHENLERRCAVSTGDREFKDKRTDEYYGIEPTAAFDLGWDSNSVKGTVTLQRAGQVAVGAQFPDAGKWP